MTAVATLAVEVAALDDVTPLIRRFTLRALDGSLLPPFSGGSHITVIMPGRERTFRNPYSLLSSPRELDAYQIAVRRDDHGRGGSLFMHRDVKLGSRLEISHPINLFPLAKLAKKHILIAGGVGITPMLAMIADLSLGSIPWELHYCIRNGEHAFFGRKLTETFGGRVRLYDASTGPRLDFDSLLHRQPLGTHLYVCGPERMTTAAFDAARTLGWPESHLHSEQFAPPPPGQPFEVYLAKSQLSVHVPPERSLLEAIEAVGVEAPYLCRSGACGHCVLNVLDHDGELIHHDHWLSDEEQQAGTKIMPCVSRAKGQRLVLDL